MADENFILTLVGRLDEKTTKKNVQDALNNISGSVKVNNKNGSAITVFDKRDLEDQGRKYLESANNVKEQLMKMFDPTGTRGLEIKLDEMFDDQGLARFKAKISEAGQLINTLNFDRAKFTDNTEGFILKSSTERDIEEIRAVDAAMQSMGQTLTQTVAGWGSMKSTYADINAFLSDYQQSVLGKNGDPTTMFTFNSKNEVTGFTSQIKDLDGQLQKLHFTLVKIRDDDGNVIDTFFKYTGGNVNANAFEQTAKQLEAQMMSLERYKITLKEIGELSLNPQSKMFVGDSDSQKLQEVTDKFNKLKDAFQLLQDFNEKGEVIPIQTFDKFIIKLRELQSELKLLRKESGNNIDRDESAATLARNVDTARSKIDLLIERWKQAGVYTGDFKQKVDILRSSLDGIKSNKELDTFNDKLKTLTNNAQQLQVQMRTMARDEQLTQRLRILKQQLDAFANANPKAATVYKAQFDSIREGIEKATRSEDLRKLTNEFRSLKIAAQDAGLAGKTFGQRMQETFSRIMRFTGITSLFMALSRGFKELLSNVKELDTAMVNLRRVTEESDQVYSDVFKNATATAKDLHTEITNIVEATAEFAKLGYDINESQELAKAAIVYQNVGWISSTEEATKSLISTMKAFNIEAEDAMEIVDKFDKIGNSFAIDSEGVGEALQRSASSLATANNTLSESIGLIVSANNVIQDPATVGF